MNICTYLYNLCCCCCKKTQADTTNDYSHTDPIIEYSDTRLVVTNDTSEQAFEQQWTQQSHLLPSRDDQSATQKSPSYGTMLINILGETISAIRDDATHVEQYLESKQKQTTSWLTNDR